jgi:hypothetical protein
MANPTNPEKPDPKTHPKTDPRKRPEHPEEPPARPAQEPDELPQRPRRSLEVELPDHSIWKRDPGDVPPGEFL